MSVSLNCLRQFSFPLQLLTNKSGSDTISGQAPRSPAPAWLPGTSLPLLALAQRGPRQKPGLSRDLYGGPGEC